MEITEVRIKLVERPSERLRAFCSITLDGDFVIRDLKIIDGTNGAFVAMPSRKLADRCPRCGSKNHLRAKFCNECGAKLNENRAPKDPQGRAKLHADVAHPINAECRERIQSAVVKAFEAELERSKSPDYRPPKYDDFEVDLDDEVSRHHHRTEPPAAKPESPPPPPRPEPAPVAKRPPVPEPEEPAPVGAGQESETEEAGFSDYNSLIAELKRDAAGRRDRHEESRGFRGQGQPDRSRSEGQRDEPSHGQPRGDHGGGRFAGGGGRQERGPRDHGRGRGGPRGGRSESSPPTPRPAAPPPPPPPPPPPKRDDDDFGAGL